MTKEQRTALRKAAELLLSGQNALANLSYEQDPLFAEYQDDDKKPKPEDKMPKEELDYLHAILDVISPSINDLYMWSDALDETERLSWDWLFPVPSPKGE
jgi:hypothetical protein